MIVKIKHTFGVLKTKTNQIEGNVQHFKVKS